MRASLPALVLVVLALTGLAGSAAGAPGRHTMFAAPAGQSLRGRQTPAEDAAPPVRLAPLPASGGGLPGAPPPLDGNVCRRSCAQAYYFCMAADTADACGSTWGQCRAGCAAPNFSGLPQR